MLRKVGSAFAAAKGFLHPSQSDYQCCHHVPLYVNAQWFWETTVSQARTDSGKRCFRVSVWKKRFFFSICTAMFWGRRMEGERVTGLNSYYISSQNSVAITAVLAPNSDLIVAETCRFYRKFYNTVSHQICSKEIRLLWT